MFVADSEIERCVTAAERIDVGAGVEQRCDESHVAREPGLVSEVASASIAWCRAVHPSSISAFTSAPRSSKSRIAAG